jgi:biopolymer transport protein ExbD
MAVKNVYDDDVKMNLTPMIDMTFLLVVFFMLSIDLTRKEFVPVALPHALKGVEDKMPPKLPRFVINLLNDGTIVLKGHPYKLASEDKAVQRQALDALRSQLQQLVAANPKWRDADLSSQIPVMIHGDRDARWQYVQWIMQICADPNIRIYKIQFAVHTPIDLIQENTKEAESAAASAPPPAK